MTGPMLADSVQRYVQSVSKYTQNVLQDSSVSGCHCSLDLPSESHLPVSNIRVRSLGGQNISRSCGIMYSKAQLVSAMTLCISWTISLVYIASCTMPQATCHARSFEGMNAHCLVAYNHVQL